jgi:hypothetical protein
MKNFKEKAGYNFFLSLFLLSLSIPWAFSQQNDLYFSGNFSRTPFELFVREAEKQLPVHFMYHPEMVDSIFVTGSFNQDPFRRVLNRIFAGHRIYFFMNSNNQIILTEGFKVEPGLPVNFFERTDEKVEEEEIQVIDFFESEEKITGPQRPVENIVIEIGTESRTVDKKYAHLAGHLRDADTGEPLIGAYIYIEEPRIGAVTNENGFYSISLPKGRQELMFRYIGYRDTKIPVIIYGEGILDIEMQEKIIPLKEVVIESERDMNVTGMQMGLERISLQTMKNVPPVMGEVDVMRIALSLPGVQSVGEGASGINVRGGAADQNLMLINDAPVYNPSHFFGFFSSFNPDIVKSIELHKGGIEARYGGRISSIFEVQAKEGNFKKFVGSGGISPVTARLTLEGPILKDKLSYIFGGRTTYSDWILKQLPDPALKNSSASFYDLFGKIVYTINEKNSIQVAGYYSKDRFRFNSDTTFHYNNQNISIQWKHIFTNKLVVVFSGIYSGYHYDITSTENEVNAFDLAFSISNYAGKIDFSWYPWQNHKIDFGINSLFYGLSPGTIKPDGNNSLVTPVELENEQGLENSVYLGDKFDLNDNLSVYAGLRYSFYQYLGPGTVNQYQPDGSLEEDSKTGETTYGSFEKIKGYHGPEFRLSVRHSLNWNSSLKLSYNRMRQYIHMLSNTTTISPTDIWKLSDPYIKPQVGDQVSLGYYINLKNNTIEGSVEGYYKNTRDVLDYKYGAELILNDQIETDIINGLGRSYGIEFILKKKTGKLNGWFSYTYSRALIKVDPENERDRINNGNYFPASYDKPHAVNLLSNWKFSRRLSLSANLTYSTGRPITYPLAKYYFSGTQRVHYSERNQFRIEDYFRLDLSLNFEGNHKIKKLNHSSWTLAVYNLTGRDNPYSIYFVSQEGRINGYKLSIFDRAIPTITYNFRF